MHKQNDKQQKCALNSGKNNYENSVKIVGISAYLSFEYEY